MRTICINRRTAFLLCSFGAEIHKTQNQEEPTAQTTGNSHLFQMIYGMKTGGNMCRKFVRILVFYFLYF